MKYCINHPRQGMKWFLVSLMLLSGMIYPNQRALAQARKVKIFLLAGQSNMQGHASEGGLKNILCAKGESSFDGCNASPESQEERLFQVISAFYGTHPTYDSVHARTEAQLINGYDLVDARLLFPSDQVSAINFNYKRNDDGERYNPGIWSGPLKAGFGHTNDGSSYGPELALGHVLAQYTDDDIVLVKVAEGGTNLHVQWRSPGMEARLGQGDEPSNYPLLIQHLNEVRADIGSYISKYEGQDVETEIAGFVWFQGWNDAKLAFAPEYEQNLTDLITDLRADLGMPQLPVVIGQTQNTSEYGLIVRAAQEAVGNNIGHAASVYTQDLSNYFHFDPGSHLIIGTRMGEAMKDLLDLQKISEPLPNAPTKMVAAAQPILTVSLTWADNANNEKAYWVERSTNPESGFEVIAKVPANTTSYSDYGVSDATTYYYRVRNSNRGGYSAYSNLAEVSLDSIPDGLPEGWSNMDIGSPDIGGYTTYSDGRFYIVGNGRLKTTDDNFHFAYRKLEGDGVIIGQLTGMTKAWWDHVGMMMRESLEPDAKYAMTLVNAKETIRFMRRKDSADVTSTDNLETTVPVWLKLERSGSIFTAYWSNDGDTWHSSHQDTIAMKDEIYVGMAAFATTDNKSTGGGWENITLLYAPLKPTALEAKALSSSDIALDWADNAHNEMGYKVERSLYVDSAFAEIAVLPPNSTSFVDSDLQAGTTYYYRVSAFTKVDFDTYSSLSEVVNTTTEPIANGLPEGWSNMDIGSPDIAGYTTYSDGKFYVAGNGYMKTTDDNFHFAYHKLAGNGVIIGQLTGMPKAHWDNTGLMMRESLEPDAKYAMTLVNAKDEIRFMRRKASDDVTRTDNLETTVPVWLKLERSGSIFTAYWSNDGDTWHSSHQDTIAMKDEIYVGMASFAPRDNKSTGGGWENVSINQTPDETIPLGPSNLTVQQVSSSSIAFSWEDNSDNELGFRVERSLKPDTGFTEIAILSSNATYLKNGGLLADTTYYYRVRAFNDAGASVYSEILSVTTDSLTNPLPEGWSNMDIGSPDIAGYTNYSDGKFYVVGNGRLKTTDDNFHFAYRKLAGDGVIIGQLTGMPKSWWNHVGMMMRESLEPDAKYAMTLVKAKETILFMRRKDSDDMTSTDNLETTVPVWLKLERSGSIFTAYWSNDGDTWHSSHQDTIVMKDEIYVGMAAFATTDNKSTGGGWENVQVAILPNELAPPSSLVASVNLNNGVELTWSDNSDNETGFVVERSADGETGFEEIATVAANTSYFQDHGIAAGKYYYRVKAIKQEASSYYSLAVIAEVLEYDNIILHMPRLVGDYDRANTNNEISITTSANHEKERFIHTGMRGRTIDVSLEYPLSFNSGTISMKITPANDTALVDFFRSEHLTISQRSQNLSVTFEGIEEVHEALLDTITCNHLVFRMTDGLAEFYVNGSWIAVGSSSDFTLDQFSLGEYNGQIWDVRIFANALSNSDVTHLSQRCVSDIQPESLPYADKPKSICGPYFCKWSREDVDIRQEKYLYHLRFEQLVFESFKFKAAMYDHQKDLYDQVVLNEGNHVVGENDKWIMWSFSDPARPGKKNVSYWLHEHFHGYQTGFGRNSKWFAEASANWAAWFYYKYPDKGVGAVTLDPHLPMQLHYGGYNRIYHWSILVSYLTEFISDPTFVGKVYNNPMLGSNSIMSVLDNQLAKEGQNFDDVFVEFAARTTVWDYPDRSISDAFEARTERGKNSLEEQGYVDFDHTFTNVMSYEGTNGAMTAIKDTLKPGVYAWNAYKVDSTAAATYTIKLRGKDVNPDGTRFRAVIVKGSGEWYEYHEMPVSEAAAFGEAVAEYQISAQAGEELYLVVVSMPTENLGNTDIRYDYTYSFEFDGNSNARKGQEAGLFHGEFKVYPNATDGHVTIELPADPNENIEVSILNNSGQQIPFEVNQQTNLLNVQFEGSSGLYYIRVKSANYDRTIKMLKK